MNLVVFPKRSIRLHAGAMRTGNDSVDEMLRCLKKHRSADARDDTPLLFDLLFKPVSILAFEFAFAFSCLKMMIKLIFGHKISQI